MVEPSNNNTTQDTYTAIVEQDNIMTKTTTTTTTTTSSTVNGEKPSKTEKIERQLEEATAILQENVKKGLERSEKLESLQNSTEKFASNTSDFQRTAKKVSWQMTLKNWKMTIILSSVLIIFVLVIILIVLGNLGLLGHSSRNQNQATQ